MNHRKRKGSFEKKEPTDEEIEFEDLFEDEIVEEDWSDNGSDGDFDGSSGEDDDGDETTEVKQRQQNMVWIGEKDALLKSSNLEFDPSGYLMLHRATADWSCLSFDVVPDRLGLARESFPHTVYVVAGTQAESFNDNEVLVMKWSGLHKTVKDSGDTDDSSSDTSDSESSDAGDEDASVEVSSLSHKGTINRVRVCRKLPSLVATWSDSGKVHIWDIDDHVRMLDGSTKSKVPNFPIKTFDGHTTEGYGLDWHPSIPGKLLTGSCDGSVALWIPVEGGWTIVFKPENGKKNVWNHNGSVEDVEWRKGQCSNGFCFGTACTDKCIRVFDIREENSKGLVISNAHDSDVNVISWNDEHEELIMSGGDDGVVKSWDLRFPEEPLAKFIWHKNPITSVQWNPFDSSEFACSSADDSITLWDLSVEPVDPVDDGSLDVPDQMLFQHFGQTEITELRFHPQITGVIISTAVDGFNIFKPRLEV